MRKTQGAARRGRGQGRSQAARIGAFILCLALLLYSLHLTGWALELLWLGPGRLRPWPWIAPTGMVVQAFRRMLLLLAGADTAVGMVAYVAVALGRGGLTWAQKRGRAGAWVAAGVLLTAAAAALEWYGVQVTGSWGYRHGTPQLTSPWGAWAVVPLLRRVAVPLVSYRLAWRLAW